MGRTTEGAGTRRTAIAVVIALFAAMVVVATPVGASDEQHVTLHALAVVEGSGGMSSTGTTNAFRSSPCISVQG